MKRDDRDGSVIGSGKNIAIATSSLSARHAYHAPSSSTTTSSSSSSSSLSTATILLYSILFISTIITLSLNILHHKLVITMIPGGGGTRIGGGGAVSPSSDATAAFLEHFVLPEMSDSGNDIASGAVDIGNGGSEAGEKQEHSLSGLSCAQYNGPNEDTINEMIYWSDIPSDSTYVSPFRYANNERSSAKDSSSSSSPKYLTFEPDHGGWNNIRMAMETTLVLAHAMGRTLVLPPNKPMYLLGRKSLSFEDFFHLDTLSNENEGMDIITMEQFLTREGMTGNLKDIKTGETLYPPNNQVDWHGAQNLKELFLYLRKVGVAPPDWDHKTCLAAFPATTDPANVDTLRQMMEDIKSNKLPQPADYEGKPIPVNSKPKERLKESLAGRSELCIYDETLRNADVIHLHVDPKTHTRYLVHFYSFVYFEDWKVDLWTKRFIRDHVRYVDEIMCAAGRVLQALREEVRTKNKDNANGVFDSFHVRRGDFQYKKTRVGAEVLYKQSKDKLQEGTALYICTDERDKDFFKPLSEHYKLYFLDDFKHLLQGVDSSYLGMIDSLVASKGRIFFGTWWSSFSGYTNRLRGYHSTKNQLDGYRDGTLESYYFIPNERKYEMKKYWPSRLPFFMREFPTAWRDIDLGIKEIAAAPAA